MAKSEYRSLPSPSCWPLWITTQLLSSPVKENETPKQQHAELAEQQQHKVPGWGFLTNPINTTLDPTILLAPNLSSKIQIIIITKQKQVFGMAVKMLLVGASSSSMSAWFWVLALLLIQLSDNAHNRRRLILDPVFESLLPTCGNWIEFQAPNFNLTQS